jgi:hypothetical protein
MCFSRVVWGQGPHIYFRDTRVVLRRLCGDFIRILVRVCLNMAVPTVFKSERENGSKRGSGSESKRDSDRKGLSDGVNENKNTTVEAANKRDIRYAGRVLSGDTYTPPRSPDLTLVPLQVHGRAARIVLYSRGSTGHGRSMQVD